jgi:hypothetical protein
MITSEYLVLSDWRMLPHAFKVCLSWQAHHHHYDLLEPSRNYAGSCNLNEPQFGVFEKCLQCVQGQMSIPHGMHFVVVEAAEDAIGKADGKYIMGLSFDGVGLQCCFVHQQGCLFTALLECSAVLHADVGLRES